MLRCRRSKNVAALSTGAVARFFWESIMIRLLRYSAAAFIVAVLSCSSVFAHGHGGGGGGHGGGGHSGGGHGGGGHSFGGGGHSFSGGGHSFSGGGHSFSGG